MTTPKMVVFTDVDGTLLDEKYSFGETEATVERLKGLDVAIVLVSSKTRVELEFYRQKLGIIDPFIVENGAAIYVPSGYFTKKHSYTKQTLSYDIIELGIPYSALRTKLKTIQKKVACNMVGFGDMSVEQVAADTGLPIELAVLAKQREYTEPVRIIGECEERFFDLAKKEGLSLVRGDRYYHVTGNHDKGKAVSALEALFAAEFGGLVSFGVGNGENDYSMLNVVSYPFFVGAPSERGAVWLEIIRGAVACVDAEKP
jgi:mannosyl-3-phosphoglycerate phosphatase